MIGVFKNLTINRILFFSFYFFLFYKTGIQDVPSVFVIYCCITSPPKSQWLQTTTIIYFAQKFPIQAGLSKVSSSLLCAVLAGVGQRIYFQDNSLTWLASQANFQLGAQPRLWTRGLMSFPRDLLQGLLGLPHVTMSGS